MKGFRDWLRDWLRDPECGDFCISGNGEQSTWGDLYEEHEIGPSLWSQLWRLIWALIWTNPPPSSFGLVATTSPRKYSNFTRWVVNYLVPFNKSFREFRKRRRNRRYSDVENVRSASIPLPPRKTRVQSGINAKSMGVWSSERGGLTLASPISTIVACLLPTIAIAVLSRLHGLTNLLLCLAGFVVIFALGVASFTNCSRVEVFTATAA